MERLIYLCSLGSAAYSTMTELCIRSLRTIGGYRGPVLVLTDNGFNSTDHDVEVDAWIDRAITHTASLAPKKKRR